MGDKVGTRFGCLDILAKLAQIVAPILTVATLYMVIQQTSNSGKQLALQRESLNRTWAAQLLVTIYQDPPGPRHVREEAVRAYIALQRDLGKRARLPGADLSEMELAGEQFGSPDLKADLRNALFKKTNLRRATFASAELAETNFESADLTGARFEDANLSRARFASADLTGAFLSGATLFGTQFSDLDSNTNFAYLPATARGARFDGAKFDEGTNLAGVDVKGAFLDKAEGLTLQHVEKALRKSEARLPASWPPL